MCLTDTKAKVSLKLTTNRLAISFFSGSECVGLLGRVKFEAPADSHPKADTNDPTLAAIVKRIEKSFVRGS